MMSNYCHNQTKFATITSRHPVYDRRRPIHERLPMCGIVGAVSTRNIVPILVEGLKRLEYRGYDSCGVAVHQDGELRRARSTARVAELDAQVARDGVEGGTGIAHTRWATHGAPAVHNAHPHFSHGAGAEPRRRSRPGRIALVHNGIIENHDELRAELAGQGLRVREPDRHRGHRPPGRPPLRRRPVRRRAARHACALKGAYAIAVFCRDEPHRVVGARAGSPLVLGVGARARTSSPRDAMALAGVTDQIVYLEEGDVVDLQLGKHWITRRARRTARTRPCSARCAPCTRTAARPSSGPYRHYMQKEIFEQPRAIADTLEGVDGHLARAVRRRRAPHLQGGRLGADPGLRHELLRGLDGQVLARRHRPHPDQRRGRQRVPLPRQRAQPAHARRHDHRRAARRPTRCRR